MNKAYAVLDSSCYFSGIEPLFSIPSCLYKFTQQNAASPLTLCPMNLISNFAPIGVSLFEHTNSGCIIPSTWHFFQTLNKKILSLRSLIFFIMTFSLWIALVNKVISVNQCAYEKFRKGALSLESINDTFIINVKEQSI